MTEGSLYRVYLNSSNKILAPVGGFKIHLDKFSVASLPRYRSMKWPAFYLGLSPIPALLSVLVVSCKLHVRLLCLVPRGRSSPAGVCTAERYSVRVGKEVRVNVVNDMVRQVTPTSIAGTRFCKV